MHPLHQHHASAGGNHNHVVVAARSPPTIHQLHPTNPPRRMAGIRRDPHRRSHRLRSSISGYTLPARVPASSLPSGLRHAVTAVGTNALVTSGLCDSCARLRHLASAATAQHPWPPGPWAHRPATHPRSAGRALASPHMDAGPPPSGSRPILDRAGRSVRNRPCSAQGATHCTTHTEHRIYLVAGLPSTLCTTFLVPVAVLR